MDCVGLDCSDEGIASLLFLGRRGLPQVFDNVGVMDSKEWFHEVLQIKVSRNHKHLNEI